MILNQTPGRPRGDLDTVIDRLRDRMRIAVIHGGDRHESGSVIFPTHNPRSEKRYEVVAAEIAGSLRRSGFRHVEVLAEDMRLGERLARGGFQMAWLNSGGTQGYVSVSHAPSMLELLGVPYVGHNPMNAAILDNKHVFKHLLRSAGIPTPRFEVFPFAEAETCATRRERLAQLVDADAAAYIVKPVSGRASQNVTLVPREQLLEAVNALSRSSMNHVMVEEYLPGDEYTVGVFGPLFVRGGRVHEHDGPCVLPPVQRLLDNEAIVTSMDVRPITRDRIRVLEEGRDGERCSQLAGLARRIFDCLRLETAVRADLRCDREGRLQVMEANPKPDLKEPDGERINLIAAGIASCGMSYDDLIMSLLANRLDFLLRHRQPAVRHLLALIGAEREDRVEA